MPPVEPGDDRFDALRRLLDAGRCWVKLSAPYESISDDSHRYDTVAALVHALVDHAPDRLLWASNWPHPGHPGEYDEAMLLDLLLDWAEDEGTRRRILADNPAELYGF